MSDPTVRRSEFHGQNLFFLAVLGLLAGSSRVRGILERHGAPEPGGARLAPVDVDGDPVLAALLGVVALRERLLAHVSAGLTAPVHAAGGEAASVHGLRALLR